MVVRECDVVPPAVVAPVVGAPVDEDPVVVELVVPPVEVPPVDVPDVAVAAGFAALASDPTRKPDAIPEPRKIIWVK